MWSVTLKVQAVALMPRVFFRGVNDLGSVACCRYHCASDDFHLLGGVLLGTSNDCMLF